MTRRVRRTLGHPAYLALDPFALVLLDIDPFRVHATAVDPSGVDDRDLVRNDSFRHRPQGRRAR